MKICVTEPGVFTGDDLQPGRWYDCAPADDGTDRQNRAFHALLQCYWSSGQHSYNARNFEHFRELIKLHLGAGAEKFYRTVGEDGTPLEKPALDWRVKSWRRYTKKERGGAVDGLIAEMIQAGVNSRKFEEILEGLEGDGCEYEKRSG